MNIQKTLNILILLVSASGFTSLFLTNTINPVFSVFFLISLLAGFIHIHKPGLLRIKRSLLTAGLLLAILVLVADFIFTSTELLTTLINLLLVLHAFKLVSEKKTRDYYQIILLSFFQVVASCVITTSFSFGFILVIYLFLSLLTLIVLNIKKESDEVFEGMRNRLDINSLVRFEILIIVFVLALTTVFFLVMPRFRGEFLSGGFTKQTLIKSGFSDEVTLGRIGEIKSDSSPVMRVYIEGHQPDDLNGPIYWRGLALDEFNGKTWKVGNKTERTFFREDAYGDTVVKEFPRSGNNLIKQEIITEPLDSKVLFSASKPVRYSDIPGNRIISFNDSYLLPDFRRSRIQYTVYSKIETPDYEVLQKDIGKIPVEIAKKYAGNFPSSEKFKDIVKNLYEKDRSNFYNTRKVKEYLLLNYRYTRMLEKGGKPYPIEEFLFRNKQGHCEYFASAMVLILREMGIPSRIVTGFLGGEFNRHGNFYLVRESNAHAWVEVYFPDNGWVLFDPTPEATNAMSSLNAPFISSYIDFLKYRWSRYVIDFTRRDQLSLFENLNSNITNAKINITENPVSGIKFNRFVKLFFAALVLAFIVIKIRGLSFYNFNNQSDRASKIFYTLIRKLEKYGFKRKQYQTLQEFTDEVAEKSPKLHKRLNEIIELFQEIRFGGDSSKNKIERLNILSREFKAFLSDK